MSDHDDLVEVFADEGDRAMDLRLRNHAEVWKESVPISTSHLVKPHPRIPRTWLAPIAVGAATVAVIAGVTTVTRAGEPGQPTSTTAPAASATVGVVPWRELPATNPDLPTTTTSASPSAAQILAARACTSADLQLAESAFGDGASGVLYFHIGVRAVSSPCRLDAGYPTISALRGGNPVSLEFVDQHTSGLPVSPVLVTKANPAALILAAPTSQCPAVTFDALHVRLLGADLQGRVSARFVSFCDSRGGLNPLSIWPIQSETPPHPVVDSPFDHIRATGDLDLVVPAGSPARFDVTLTSPRDLPLVPCPDYEVVTAIGQRRAGLNCEGVPFRDEEGRPYLPAGRPVTFAMEVQTGDQDTSKFVWQLRGSAGAVQVEGSITVAQ